MAEKRAYEVMYIAAPETADEDVTKLNESLQQIIENGGGSIVKTDVMGRRKLAYPINKKTEGITRCLKSRVQVKKLPSSNDECALMMRLSVI